MGQDSEQTAAPQEFVADSKPQAEGGQPSRLQTFGAAIAALVLYALLIDAAVETFLSGSPLRWIVAGAVAAYLILTVLLWKRLRWGTKAALSLLVLLGLLAVTAWLPDGLSRGVNLARQSTAVVLAAVSALAVLGSVIFLVRVKLIPLLAKILIGLLGAYGVAAFILGIEGSVPYGDLFHGRSLWERIPFWPQGAFVGALVVVPVALLVCIVYGVVRIRGGQLRGWAVQVLALASIVGMAAAGVTGPIGLEASSQIPEAARSTSAPTVLQSESPSQTQPATGPTPVPQTAGATGPSVPQLTVTADEFVRILKAYLRLAKVADRSSFDVKARARKLSGDVGVAFDFVRDQIANEIYSGVLRGAKGALSSLAGNDLDKALLLGALLNEQKYQVRYAQCTLSNERAQERVRSMFGRAERPPISHFGRDLVIALVQEGIPESRSNEIVKSLERSHDALDQIVKRTAQGDRDIIRGTLSSAGIQPMPLGNLKALLDESRPHYWVQVDVGDRWEDLDPAFAQAQRGQTFCAAEQTYASLPDDVYQSVTINVRNEYVEGGKLRSALILKRKFLAAELHSQVIFFGNVPAAGATMNSGRVASARTFVPVIIDGQSLTRGEAFQIASEAASGPADLFGQALGNAGPTLAAQWLDFELTSPQKHVSVNSRSIVDAVNPEERARGEVSSPPDLDLAAAQLMEGHAIVISTGQLNILQMVDAVYSGLNLEAMSRVLAVASGSAQSDQVASDIAANEFPVLAAGVFALGLESDRLLADSRKALGPHIAAFRDQPFIAIANVAIRRSVDKNTFAGTTTLDLRNNALRFVSDQPRSAIDAFWAYVHHGMAEGALERVIPVYRPLLISGTRTPSNAPTGISTGALLEAARSQGIELRAMTSSSAIKALREDLSRAGGYRLAAEIVDRYAVVLPLKPVIVQNDERLALWAVDLETGQVVSFVDTGLRAGTAEQGIIRKIQSMGTLTAEKMMVLEAARRACLEKYGPLHEACRKLFQDWIYQFNILHAIGDFAIAVQQYFGLPWFGVAPP